MRTWLSRLRDQRGNAVLEFLVVTPLLVFLTFGGINHWQFQVRQGYLENIKDRYLQEAQLEGGFSRDLWGRMLDDLKRRHFDVSKLQVTGSTPVDQYVRRGNVVVLNIGYPTGDGLSTFKLIGLQPGDANKIVWVSGSILSERP